jgi:hypothetical protein
MGRSGSVGLLAAAAAILIDGPSPEVRLNPALNDRRDVIRLFPFAFGHRLGYGLRRRRTFRPDRPGALVQEFGLAFAGATLRLGLLIGNTFERLAVLAAFVASVHFKLLALGAVHLRLVDAARSSQSGTHGG